MKGCVERQQGIYHLEYSGIVVTHGGALFHARQSPEMVEKAYAIITLDKREKGKGDACSLENP